jgi:hypothetical protein
MKLSPGHQMKLSPGPNAIHFQAAITDALGNKRAFKIST